MDWRVTQNQHQDLPLRIFLLLDQIKKRKENYGTHVNPWLIHVNVWQKPLQCCKVISFQLIKINEKKKKENYEHM